MQARRLTPCFIGSGTLTNPKDMVRALETLEGFRFSYEVDGHIISEGRAGLVKLMADGSSSTLLVNGCLFLNVGSFRYLSFGESGGEQCFELVGDGTLLTLTVVDEPEERTSKQVSIRLLEEDAYDSESFVALEDDEDED